MNGFYRRWNVDGLKWWKYNRTAQHSTYEIDKSRIRMRRKGQLASSLEVFEWESHGMHERQRQLLVVLIRSCVGHKHNGLGLGLSLSLSLLMSPYLLPQMPIEYILLCYWKIKTKMIFANSGHIGYDHGKRKRKRKRNKCTWMVLMSCRPTSNQRDCPRATLSLSFWAARNVLLLSSAGLISLLFFF